MRTARRVQQGIRAVPSQVLTLLGFPLLWVKAPSQKANMGVKVFWDTNPDPLQ